MAIRFRKSVKLAPGVRMNIGKKGVGFSTGVKGASVSTSARGTNLNVGIPGTGLSSSHRIMGKKTTRPQRAEYDRIQAQKEKAAVADHARLQVEEYQAHVNMLTSMHIDSTEPIDWEKRALSPLPFSEKESGPSYTKALETIKQYKPTVRDRLFNRIEQRKEALQALLLGAAAEDQKSLDNHHQVIGQAKRVLANDPNEWSHIINVHQPFEDIEKLHGKVTYQVIKPGIIVANLEIESEETVPQHVLSLTKTGKLSEKKMAKGKYLQLYQDFVASGMLRIAREFFALLPVETVIVHTYGYSQATEPAEYGCLLSMKVQRGEVENIEWERIDCSDTVERFEHNMKFLKTKGFKLVQEVHLP
ncbi:DUF4236 domain-containing protein [Jeotgalibacillus proteolyticus]|uniref:DUF4236 domain-containing protein n=1 Tax=Jeotgalibacillus proteolyticus TaxID=2082395 RepID=A0A2S5G777_9BACL|nr:DUF4236 domain-containing protein [Jeotgalibacillus proteolyticus]PPA68726.1 hypothetical protein C4B60_19345 [Jeotgalibacillus proteolyticus]PPA68803.1 hypothetical protein C4B60_19775 [Jeotgalibacillus proteolyticus]